ncbi:hypothetical protein [Bifidobacterium sp. SO1]|uniref:hypothetical protein n=1 Tax=Bifidobacterium sp. SO1 TaxID=2809029 RepID=UPI001BDBC65D|nr:hypothetical protein [Bifidobacterium sp. SO1]MBT1162949.1 hypothetical protein [Bifidobacterium sp. SO1]
MEKATRFQRMLKEAKTIRDVSVLADSGHRLYVEFSLDAPTIREANYRSGRIILRTLAACDAVADDLEDIDGLKTLRDIDRVSERYATDFVIQLSLERDRSPEEI